jgi:hypothetical protein
MPTFTAENRDAWNALFASVAGDRPSVGKRVRIVEGRKHRGLEGRVIWHGEDHYYMAAHRRFMSDAQAALNEARGRQGWRVGIQPDVGSPVYVNAAYVEVLPPGDEHGRDNA